MAKKLQQIPSVVIDDEGTFKYVLIEAYETETNGEETSKLLVRGFRRAEYHADVYDETEEKIRHLGLDCQCLGGGRIQRGQNVIKVYGYSMGFGRADHSKTTALIKEAFPGIDVEWSNEGY